jgi:hypothetical protein
MGAKVQLTIDTNFAEASRQFKAFGDLSEKEIAKIERAVKKYNNEAAEAFINKNERAAIAAQAFGGKLDYLKTRTNGLQAEMQRMIRAGIDPQSEAVKKLKDEYVKSTIELKAMEQAQKRTTDGVKALERAAIAELFRAMFSLVLAANTAN